MPYDRYRIPALSHKQRIYDWLCVLALVLMLAAIIAVASIVVMVISA